MQIILNNAMAKIFIFIIGKLGKINNIKFENS